MSVGIVIGIRTFIVVIVFGVGVVITCCLLFTSCVLCLALQAKVDVLYVQQLQDPLIRLNPGADSDGDNTSLAPGPPPQQPAPGPAGSGGRRLLEPRGASPTPPSPSRPAQPTPPCT